LIDYNKKSEESREQYIHRICSQKSQIGSWEDVATILRKELGETYDESAYRKTYQAFELMYESVKDQFLNGEHIELLEEAKDKLYKQQIKTRDMLREKRKTLRDEARVEVMKDAIKESFDNCPVIQPINYSFDINEKKEGREAIVLLSDWHIGDKFENFRNSYSLEIATRRVGELGRNIVKYAHMMNVTKLNFLNLGDSIAGNIHGSIRVMAEIDVAEQVKFACALIYQLIAEISKDESISEITYRSCLDNHSRINKDYSEHIEKESFAMLLDWHLQDKFESCTRVKYINDNIDPNIGAFKTNNGKQVFFVHGHLDSIKSVIQDLTLGTGIIADLVCMGHFHTDKVKNFHGKKVYCNGSLKGTDPYALGHRLFGDPSQKMLVFDGRNTIDIPIEVE
jgi:uncharacterized LabA/DUF88 family protein